MITTIRASSLNRAYVCPGSLGLPSSSTGATERGTLIHAWLQAHFEGRHDEKPQLPDGLDLSDFAHWAERKVTAGATELRCEVEGAIEVAGVVITGHADLIFEHPVLGRWVVDWKSGAGYTLPPIESDLQMAAYAAIFDAAIVHRIAVEALGIDASLERTPELVGKLYYAIESIVRREGQLTVGSHCDGCSCRASCPVRTEQARALVPAFDGVAIVSREQVVRGLRALRPAKDLLEAFEKAARMWIEVNGPVEDQGQVYGPKSHMRAGTFSLTRDKAVELASALGVDGERMIAECERMGAWAPAQVTRYAWTKKR